MNGRTLATVPALLLILGLSLIYFGITGLDRKHHFLTPAPATPGPIGETPPATGAPANTGQGTSTA